MNIKLLDLLFMGLLVLVVLFVTNSTRLAILTIALIVGYVIFGFYVSDTINQVFRYMFEIEDDSINDVTVMSHLAKTSFVERFTKHMCIIYPLAFFFILGMEFGNRVYKNFKLTNEDRVYSWIVRSNNKRSRHDGGRAS